MERLILVSAAICIASAAASQEDAGLFPFVIPWDDSAPSVANVSALNEAPAGEDGFITVRDGHFVDGSGERIRFIGTNLCFASAFPPHSVAEKFARRMAKFGINIVRFHHMDNAPFPRGIWDGDHDDRQHLSAEALDRLDYMIHQLKENGIYANINLHVSRKLTEADGIEQAGEMPKYDKGVDNFHPRMIELQRSYARDLLTHTNPYTGNAYTDEPAVAMIEINNENALTRQWRTGEIDACPGYVQAMLDERWNAWLSERYPSTDALREAWDTEAQPLSDVELLANADLAAGTEGWTAQINGTAKASLEATQDGIGEAAALKLTIEETSDTSWHVQLFQAGLAFEEGAAYTLSFAAKAEPERSVGVNAFRAEAPWGTLGFSTNAKLGPQWQRYTYTFRATETEDTARITFSGLGLQAGTLWIAEPSLRDGGIAGLAADETPAAGNVGRPRHGEITGRSPQAAADYVAFLLDVETEYWTGMAGYLRDDLEVKQPVTGTQMGYTPAQTQAAMDYIDAHAYWHHPRFPGRPWDPNNWTITNRPMTDADGGMLPSLAARRVAGVPYTVSEYNHPAPNLYGSEAFLLLSAYAALQDWDGIFQFTYSSGDLWEAEHLDGYFNLKAHSVQLATLPIAAVLLREAAVASADRETVVHVSSADAITGGLRDPASGSYATSHGIDATTSLSHRVSVSVGGRSRTDGPTEPIAIDGGGWVSDTGQLKWHYAGQDTGRVTIDTPRVKAAVGVPEPGGTVLGDVAIEVGRTRQDWAAVAVAAMDADDVASPGRLLITATGVYQNAGWGWQADGHNATLGRNWGAAPYMVEGIPATITLPVAADRVTAHALDPSGRRASEIAVTGTGRATIVIGPQHRTLWYEVVID